MILKMEEWEHNVQNNVKLNFQHEVREAIKKEADELKSKSGDVEQRCDLLQQDCKVLNATFSQMKTNEDAALKQLVVLTQQHCDSIIKQQSQDGDLDAYPPMLLPRKMCQRPHLLPRVMYSTNLEIRSLRRVKASITTLQLTNVGCHPGRLQNARDHYQKLFLFVC